MCALETRTNFFLFKKSPKPGCVLNSGAYYIREYKVLGEECVSVPLDPLQTPHRPPWDSMYAFVKRLFGFMSS